MQQKVVVEQLLPLAPITEEEQAAATSTTEYLYEPSPQRIFDVLLAAAGARRRSCARCSSRTPRSMRRR